MMFWSYFYSEGLSSVGSPHQIYKMCLYLCMMRGSPAQVFAAFISFSTLFQFTHSVLYASVPVGLGGETTQGMENIFHVNYMSPVLYIIQQELTQLCRQHQLIFIPELFCGPSTPANCRCRWFLCLLVPRLSGLIWLVLLACTLIGLFFLWNESYFHPL